MEHLPRTYSRRLGAVFVGVGCLGAPATDASGED
jgi:hypothetical protein